MKDLITLDQLTPELRKALACEALEEEKKQELKHKKDIATYNKEKYAAVDGLFGLLQEISESLISAKAQVYNKLEALLAKKNDLYNVSETQLSHSWTNETGTVTIITGFNTIDRWDESVSVGTEKVNLWLEGQMRKTNPKFVALVRELLKPNKEGVLKASRILDLQNQAESFGDPELIQAVMLIREAHRPQHSGTFIKAKFRDSDGRWQWLPLSMSQA